MNKAKPFSITKREVYDAYKQVKANKGAAGVDGQSLELFLMCPEIIPIVSCLSSTPGWVITMPCKASIISRSIVGGRIGSLPCP